MKPYLISLASYTEGVKRYLESLKNLENSVDWVSVEFEPYLPSLAVFYRQPCPYPGNLYRFDYLPKNLDSNRWWIFTDTADVIFQRPVPNLDQDAVEVWVAPESEIHGNNGVWRGFIERYPCAHRLLDQPIYNMGGWAMKGDKAAELVEYLKQNRAKFNCHPNSDQVLYNLWLLDQPKEIIGVHPTLLVAMYANIEKGVVRKENGLWVNERGEPYCICHFNGSTKEFL